MNTSVKYGIIPATRCNVLPFFINSIKTLHHRGTTSFCLAAVTFGQYFHQVWDSCRKNIKSLTFLITDVKISHHRPLTSFGLQELLRFVNSPVYFVIISCNDMKSWIKSQINKLIFIIIKLPLHEYFCKLLDYSCKWTKRLAFVISSLKISHHRGISSCGQQEQLGWINNPVYYCIIPPMTVESAITSQISHFIFG